jgi:solute carrier family 35, member E3
MLGMHLFLRSGVFEEKRVAKHKLIPLAASYVGYIVLCNLNLNINPVGFYQITKIAVAPAVLAIEAIWYNKRASASVVASVCVVCLGVGLATITDPQISSNPAGLLCGFGSVGATALYQIWAGVQQKHLELGSMQLLHQYVPLAAIMLGVLIPMVEPLGLLDKAPGTILGYTFTPGSVAAIGISSVLGLLVNLSTFLVIGATSSLTYNIVGHVKTVIILAGGVMFFGDSMPLAKAGGIMVCMMGIVWYSNIKLKEARLKKQALPSSTGDLKGLLGGGGGGDVIAANGGVGGKWQTDVSGRNTSSNDGGGGVIPLLTEDQIVARRRTGGTPTFAALNST